MRLVAISGVIATLVTLVVTPWLIRLLRKHGYSQAIRVSTDTVTYPEHEGKRGTPSMGGAAIIIAVLIAYFGTHLITWRPVTASGLLLLFLIIGLGLVGFADDYLKIFKQRSTGLRARTKLVGQAVVALVFAYLSVTITTDSGTPASTAVSFIRDTGIVLPMGLFLLWAWFLVTATTNGVNLTDGLDGLAVGASVMTFGAYVVITVWQFGQSCSFELTSSCYSTTSPMDLAIVAVAVAGASFAFLWFNTSPAASSWATPVPLPLAAASPAWRFFRAPSFCSPSWRGCSSSSPCPSSVRSARSSSPAGGCSAWHRCTITSRCLAGRRCRSSCAFGSSKALPSLSHSLCSMASGCAREP